MHDLTMEHVDLFGLFKEAVLEVPGGRLRGKVFVTKLGVPEFVVCLVDFFNRGLELDISAQQGRWVASSGIVRSSRELGAPFAGGDAG